VELIAVATKHSYLRDPDLSLASTLRGKCMHAMLANCILLPLELRTLRALVECCGVVLVSAPVPGVTTLSPAEGAMAALWVTVFAPR
jgi:hypothetical protein